MMKIKNCYILSIETDNFCGWAMSQKLPEKDSEQVKDILQFNDFIKKLC